jgi:hypothetical protein
MTQRTVSPQILGLQPSAPTQPRETRGVRLPTGADSKLFGGWGVRF